MDLYSAVRAGHVAPDADVTLNAGLRWDVQMPFSPVNDTMTAASLADICGVSGLGIGRDL